MPSWISPGPAQALPLNDPALPSLASLRCPQCATQTLRAAAQHGWWPQNLALPIVQAVRVLRYHPGSRCTLAWTLDGWQANVCIAKVLAHNVTAAAETLLNLARVGFTMASEQRVPTLLAVIPELNLLLLEHAAGTPISKLAPEEWPVAALRAAHWLGALSAAQLPLPGSFALGDPVAGARRWQTRIQGAAPELTRDCEQILAVITARQPPWPAPVRLIHGDFGVGHIFCGPEATTVIDWDSCRPGAPGEDAGHVLASLANLGWHCAADEGAITAALSSFRAAYAEVLPEYAPSLPIYTALACLRKASHVVERSVDRASRLLQTGQTVLAAEPLG